MNKKKNELNDISFKDRVIQVVKKIPKGKTLSYREVAELSGSPKAFRAVGSIMKANGDKTIPCHRVIKSNGTLGKYNGLQGNKDDILKKENAL